MHPLEDKVLRMIQHGWIITEVDGQTMWVKDGIYYRPREAHEHFRASQTDSSESIPLQGDED